MSKPSAQDLFLNNYLRGLAILAVIAIHTLASIHADYWPSTPGWWLAIAADQLARFAVPLFVALSGYSFWQKYRDAKSLNWFTFIWHQAKKLMPLYLLASAVFYVVFLILPSWRVGGTPPSFFEQLWRVAPTISSTLSP